MPARALRRPSNARREVPAEDDGIVVEKNKNAREGIETPSWAAEDNTTAAWKKTKMPARALRQTDHRRYVSRGEDVEKTKMPARALRPPSWGTTTGGIVGIAVEKTKMPARALRLHSVVELRATTARVEKTKMPARALRQLSVGRLVSLLLPLWKKQKCPRGH